MSEMSNLFQFRAHYQLKTVLSESYGDLRGRNKPIASSLGDEVILSGMGISASYPLVSFFTYEIILFYGSDSDIDLVLSINQA